MFDMDAAASDEVSRASFRAAPDERPRDQHVTRGPATSRHRSSVLGDPSDSTRRAFAMLTALTTAPPSWAERHPVADRLSLMDPDAHLARIAGLLDVADLDDPALVELMAAWERVGAWVASKQAEVIAEMVRRAGPSRGEEFVADEVAARLVISRRAAQHKVALAEDLAQSPDVHDALARGSIDVTKARVLTAQTGHLAPATARRVVDAVLPDADDLTAPQLRARIRRIEMALDPEATERRHVAAVAERCVRLTPAPDAMAWLTAYLPADDASRVMTAVDAVATTGPRDDGQPLDARRADALVQVMTAVLDTGVGPHGPLSMQQGRRPHIEVTVSESTLLGCDERPATLAGYGPVPATMARRIAAEGVWRAPVTDAQTGEAVARSSRSYRPSPAMVRRILARDVTCTFPGCRAPAVRCDLDHIEPFDPDRPPEEQTTERNLHALCRHHHRLKTHGGWTVSRDPGTGVTTWRSPTGKVYRREPVRPDGDVPRRVPRRTTDADAGGGNPANSKDRSPGLRRSPGDRSGEDRPPPPQQPRPDQCGEDREGAPRRPGRDPGEPPF